MSEWLIVEPLSCVDALSPYLNFENATDDKWYWQISCNFGNILAYVEGDLHI